LDRDARREAILDVAQEVFLEEGFAAASMSTIAARLGGSKGTLYNYFKSKDDLFNAYVERRCLWQTEAVGLKLDETPLQAINRVARAFLTFVTDDLTQRNFRLIVAEAERAPHISRTFYETGPARGIQRTAAFLSELEAHGLLKLDGDAEGAAIDFLGLVQYRHFKARLCNYIPALSAAQIDAEAARAVRTFLRAYGA
jgi:AcrR family transcriptional regulator